jgi:predicted enzyme related to lactoylglutathione lyase
MVREGLDVSEGRVAESVSGRFSFTKLVVHDLEAMARYYATVFGLEQLDRFKTDSLGTPIDEIMLAANGERAGLILFKYLERDAAANGEVILGFSTPDIRGLFAQAEAAGGRVDVAPYDPQIPGLALVGFLADPEGHLAEVIELAR